MTETPVEHLEAPSRGLRREPVLSIVEGLSRTGTDPSERSTA